MECEQTKVVQRVVTSRGERFRVPIESWIQVVVHMEVEPFQVFTVLLELLTWDDPEALAEVVGELSSYLWVLVQGTWRAFLCVYEVIKPFKNAN